MLLLRSASMAALLLLVTCAAHIHAHAHAHAHRSALRERDQHTCGFAHHGTALGTAQRLVAAQLAPGLPDWDIAVPMPPGCKDARVTGVETTVCDADVAPDVTMRDLLSARVHRRGQLRGFAAVNVTVHCILPSRTQTSEGALELRPDHPDTRSTDEVLSSELISNEVMSNEVTLQHESNGLTTAELMPKTMKPISTSTVSPPQETTTPRIELTSPTTVVTTTPTTSKRPKEIIPQSLKVIIQIASPSHKSAKKRKPKSYQVKLPSQDTLHEVTSSHIPEPTPPRNSMTTPRKQGRPLGMLQHHSQYTGAIPPPPRPGAPPQRGQRVPASQEFLVTSAEYDVAPPLYDVVAPYVLSPLFRPISFLRPPVRLWQRYRPMMFFQHG